MDFDAFDVFVFDLDGTLIDSGKYHAQAFADVVLSQSGYQLTPEEHFEVFASHSLSFCPILNQRHGLTLDPAAVLDEKRNRVKEIFKADLFSGAREFLDHWHGLKPFGLATNSPRNFVRPALEQVGLLNYFEHITTSDEVTHRKPHPEIFEQTFQKFGITPSKTVVFEDQLIGIEAGRAAGAKVIAIDNGQPVIFPSDVPVLKWKDFLNT
jgi:HAD superfamily hydrolase (TIGR01509 family)